MFACQECGKKFRTVTAAQRASNNGCPKCGGVDIDVDVERPSDRKKRMPREVDHAAAQAHLRTSRYAAPRQFL